MRIGLFFGTFNPIHVGHLVIANYLADHPLLDEVWLIVTPQNPFKNRATLLSDYHRLELVHLAIESNEKLRVSNIEFKLPKPNYTVDTLVCIKEKYPQHQFSLILGEDNVRSLPKWKNYEFIIQHYPVFVYPRSPTPEEAIGNGLSSIGLLTDKYPSFVFCSDLPIMNISSTYIRNAIKNKKDIRYLVTQEVKSYIELMHFYEK